MQNFYEAFLQGRATFEVLDSCNPAFESVEKAASKLATPIGLSVMVMAYPVGATVAEAVKTIFANQTPAVKTLTGENSFTANLTVSTAEETRSMPFRGQKPKPSYVPRLSTFTTTGSGDTIHVYGYYSTVERSIQKISKPDWIHEEASLPNQPAPAFYGIKVV